MSTKTAKLRVIKLTPGGRRLRDAILSSRHGKSPLQLTAVSEGALRGLRHLFPAEESDALDIELLPIGNLISRVCRLARITTMGAAQAGQAVAAIAEACRRLPAESPLAATADLPGVHAALAETLGTLRAHGIDASTLDLAASNADEHFAAKLRSLGFLLRESGDSLRQLGREHVTEWLHRTTATDPSLCDDAGQVVIVVGGRLEPSLGQWIEWLGRTKARVTVIGEIHTGLPHLFADLQHYFAGFETEVRTDHEALPDRLFVQASQAERSIALDIVSAPDLLSESEWALRMCAGHQGRDRVAIFARDLKSYAPILQAAAKRLDVAISLPWRAPLLSNRLISFFLDLLSALGASDVRTLIKPLRSPYSGLSEETKTATEAVLRDLRRGGDDAWDLLAKVAPALAEGIPWLEPVLEWRKEAIERPAEPWEWYGRIMTLADLIPWQDAAIEYPRFVERDGRAQTAMQRAITERASLAKVRRVAPMPYSAALRWMRTAWESADYSVPSIPGGIRVVADAAELGDCDHVIAVGMLEGILPRRPREDPILGDLERNELNALCSLPVALPTSKDDAAREREEFIRLCGAAAKRMTLSYRLATGDRNNIPTAYIAEAKRLCEPANEITHSRTEFCPAEPTLETDVRLAAALKRRDTLSELDFQSELIRSRFKWPLDRPFEPQQLRRATQCPLRFFARDQLKVQPSRRLQLWNRLLALPIDAELALQPDRESARVALETALVNLTDEQVGRLADWELAVIRSGGRRMITDWVDREFRARELWPRRHVRTNVRIGSPGVINKAGRDVTLHGSVPVLAEMGPYSLATLYESGAPDRLGRESTDANFLYYALWSVIAQGDAEATAIEVETLGHARRLFALPRMPGSLGSDRDHGLYAAAVTMGDENVVRAVNARARALVKLAVERAREAIVTPTPSPDHCPGCAYGELCRRSTEFGESDDPFEVIDG